MTKKDYDWAKELEQLRTEIDKYEKHLNQAITKGAYNDLVQRRGKKEAGSYEAFERDFDPNAGSSERTEGVLAAKKDIVRQIREIIKPADGQPRGLVVEDDQAPVNPAQAARGLMEDFREYCMTYEKDLKKLGQVRGYGSPESWQVKFLQFLNTVLEKLRVPFRVVSGSKMHEKIGHFSKGVEKMQEREKAQRHQQQGKQQETSRPGTPKKQ